jgi:hypothetical protein
MYVVVLSFDYGDEVYGPFATFVLADTFARGRADAEVVEVRSVRSPVSAPPWCSPADVAAAAKLLGNSNV